MSARCQSDPVVASLLLFAPLLTGCATSDRSAATICADTCSSEIRYKEDDTGRVLIFTQDRFKIGEDELMARIDPGSPISRLTIDKGKCISIGPEQGALRFAFVADLAVGKKYSCARASFEVESAVLDRPSNAGTSFLISANSEGLFRYKFVYNECAGVTSINLLEGAGEKSFAVLVSRVGILDNPAEC